MGNFHSEFWNIIVVKFQLKTLYFTWISSLNNNWNVLSKIRRLQSILFHDTRQNFWKFPILIFSHWLEDMKFAVNILLYYLHPTYLQHKHSVFWLATFEQWTELSVCTVCNDCWSEYTRFVNGGLVEERIFVSASMENYFFHLKYILNGNWQKKIKFGYSL